MKYSIFCLNLILCVLLFSSCRKTVENNVPKEALDYINYQQGDTLYFERTKHFSADEYLESRLTEDTLIVDTVRFIVTSKSEYLHDRGGLFIKKKGHNQEIQYFLEHGPSLITITFFAYTNATNMGVYLNGSGLNEDLETTFFQASETQVIGGVEYETIALEREGNYTIFAKDHGIAEININGEIYRKVP
ncbi:MAG: hypothetical protein MRY83_13015 [Flavobacteriales bacterium]|nr:hypothetical protein [Flavobacteriales bacterium]